MSKIGLLGQRVRRRMADLDIGTIKELEQMAGLPRDSVRHLIAGRTNSMRSGKLPALAAALKISVEELVAGTPIATDSSGQAIGLATQQQPTVLTGRMRADAVAVEALGAHSGSALRWVVAAGDNMQPTIEAGDVVLVNTAVQAVAGDGIYCLQAGGGAAAFRRVQVQAVGGQCIVSADNPKYTAETGVDIAALNVLGAVIGSYRRL